MAVTEKRQPWFVSGPAPELVPVRVAATQTWTAGTPVQLVDGQVKIAEDCASGATDKSIYGFSAETIATAKTENDIVYIHRITADQVWAMYVSNAGSDSAAAVDVVGDQYGHAVEASSPYKGYMTCDLGYTTYLSMQVVGILSDLDTSIVASVSTSPGVVLVRFLQAALDQVGN